MVKLVENLGALAEAPKIDDGIYEITILNETKGSSGTYLPSAVESAARVFNSGRLSFFGHKPAEDLPNRNVRREAAGKVLEAWLEEAQDGTKVAKGKYQVAPEHREFVNFFYEDIALSISAFGNGTLTEDGEMLIEELEDNPLTSIDIVFRGGTEAKFDHKLENMTPSPTKLRILESANQFGLMPEKTSVALAEDKQDKEGDILEIEKRLEKITEMLEGLVAEKQATIDAEANAEAINTAVTEAITHYSDRVKAIEAADLFKPQVEILMEKAKVGDIADELEEAKRVAEAAREAVQTGSHVTESGQFSSSSADYRVGAWS